jgi:hypothetical protein
MISLEKLREIDPKLKKIPDKELEKIREQLYSLANLSLDSYFDSLKKKENKKI